MNQHITRQISLTGYRVQFADMREPKPRTVQEELFVIDSETVAALILVGQGIPEYIRARYERGGFHVCTCEKIPGRRQIPLDLQQLWSSQEVDA